MGGATGEASAWQVIRSAAGVAAAVGLTIGCAGPHLRSVATVEDLVQQLACVGPSDAAVMSPTRGVSSMGAVCADAGDHRLNVQVMRSSNDRNTIETALRTKDFLCGLSNGYLRGANWIVWPSDDTIDMRATAARIGGQVRRC